MSDKVITEIVLLLRETDYDKNTVFLKQGDFSDKIFVVWQGEVHVEVTRNKNVHFFEVIN
jgi:hypothetical protein